MELMEFEFSALKRGIFRTSNSGGDFFAENYSVLSKGTYCLSTRQTFSIQDHDMRELTMREMGKLVVAGRERI